MSKDYPVDRECVKLAEHFIGDDIGSRSDATSITLDTLAVRSLAEDIQRAVETWFVHRNAGRG